MNLRHSFGLPLTRPVASFRGETETEHKRAAEIEPMFLLKLPQWLCFKPLYYH